MPPTRWGLAALALALVIAAPTLAMAVEEGGEMQASPPPSDQQPAEPERPKILPRAVLFDPLLADPRWPHFSAAWHDYGGRDGFHDIASVSLGDSFSFYSAPAWGGTWGVGLQGAVFAVFDLDAASHDLVNADYFIAVPLQWRKGPLAMMARIYHQSSHLGDEFLLRTHAPRVNLSYESVDLKLSYFLWGDAVRLYGGGGYLVDRDPSSLKPGLIQAGVEFRSPWTFAGQRLRPIAAVDWQAAENWGWSFDTSARIGVQLESDTDRHYVLQLTLDFFRGRNPNGQFYTNTVEFWGVGLHTYF
jgi:hypothetical protein